MLHAILILAIETLSAQPGRFGLPSCDASGQQLASRTSFVICHSANHRVPLYAAYELTPEMLNAPAVPRQHFRRDPELAASPLTRITKAAASIAATSSPPVM